MTVFEISGIRHFMSRLLGSSLFDHFLLVEGSINAGITYTLDGRINKSFFPETDMEELHLQNLDCIPFSCVRNTCFEIIRGKNTPVSFHFVFKLSPENMAHTIKCCNTSFVPDDISGMFLNINFKDGRLTCTTGISYRLFSADRSLEHEWDRLAVRFFRKNQIEIETEHGL